MHEHEAWPAALLNRFLAGPADSILNAVGLKPEDPLHPYDFEIFWGQLPTSAMNVLAPPVLA